MAAYCLSPGVHAFQCNPFPAMHSYLHTITLFWENPCRPATQHSLVWFKKKLLFTWVSLYKQTHDAKCEDFATMEFYTSA